MLGIREYAAEFAGTALLLLVGLSAVCVNFSTQSPVVTALPDSNVRRLITGIIFAGTGTAIVYSPLGKRSGGHINPAVTLAFLRLGKITPKSAAIYITVQIAGALTGAALVLAIWRGWATSVRLGATIPHDGGAAAAVAAEVVATFLVVSLILNFVDRPRLMPFTAAAAGTLVAFLVFVEAPVSGTSLNPARTLGPALVGSTLTDLWIYLLAPPLGALAAGLVYRHQRASVACGKLFHSSRVQCGFLDCQYTPPDQRVTASYSASSASTPSVFRRPAAHILCNQQLVSRGDQL